MRNLLVRQDLQAPLSDVLGSRPVENSARMVRMAMGLDRKHRYEKMVESVYGEPDAANRLLLKTLYLCMTEDTKEPLAS